MLYNKLWVYNKIEDENVGKISREAGISRLMAKIFLNRGIDRVCQIKKFLNPSMEDMHDPFLLKDMDKAADRIIKAINCKEKIVIYGDYDVDGITSASILSDFLSGRKANVEFYIPDRIDEGYGLSFNAIGRVREMGASLVITADCGITAIDEVRNMNSNNMDVIITDHHECKADLPEAFAVVNPRRVDCDYPFKELAGVGVVYKLIGALCIKLGLGDAHHRYLDLVAVGTVADVVPLSGENRVIAKYGMKKIENTANIGLKALINFSGLKGKPITSWGIGFAIAPRINAAGRIGDAGRAVKLFTGGDENRASEIAAELDEENKLRQETEAGIFQQVVEIIESRTDYKKEKVLVVPGESWHHGVIGIVSSKITERYYKPAILISTENGTGKGSGRSIEGFNLFRALCHCENVLEKYGGHEFAAGLTLKTENLPEFRKMINLYADSALDEHDLIPKVRIDVKLEKGDVCMDNIRELEMLAPFGAGNPEPVFSYSRLKINEMRTVGESRHLKLKLEDEGFFMDAIGFNMGGMISDFNNNDILDAACSLEINSWNSYERVQLNLKDIKPDEKEK